MRDNGIYRVIWKADLIRKKCASLIESNGFRFFKLEDYWNPATHTGGVDIVFLIPSGGGGKKAVHVTVPLNAQEQSRLTPSAESKIIRRLNEKLEKQRQARPPKGILSAKK